MSVLTEALRQIRDDLSAAIVATAATWPAEQIPVPPALLVYPASGPSRFGSADGGNGRPTFWNSDTVVVRVVIPRRNLQADVEALAGLVDPVRRTLIGGFTSDRFGGSTAMLGLRDGGGGQYLEYEIESIEWGGQDMLSLTFSLVVTTEDEIG